MSTFLTNNAPEIGSRHYNRGRTFVGLAIAFIAFVTASDAKAQFVWTGTTDNTWATGTNWGGGTPPFGGDTCGDFQRAQHG